jgi:hypothetical protein
MTFAARIAVVGLACLQIVIWTCPAYCERAMAPQSVAATAEGAAGHEHHQSSLERANIPHARTIDAAPIDCCGRCGLEQPPQSLTEKSSASSNSHAQAGDAANTSSAWTGQRSFAVAHAYHPPGTSPPVTCISPLRI